MHNKNLQTLCDNLNYQFNNISILQNALLHPSAANLKKSVSYERMEFFGDSILSFIICEFLYTKYTDKNEGELSKIHSFLVSRKICNSVGQKIQIANFIILSNGAEQNKERQESANIANAVESIIAAIYLDGGIENVRNFIIYNWQSFLNEDHLSEDYDYKTKLQQIIQNKYKILPIYKVLSTEGSDHNPIFTVSVAVHDMIAEGIGKNKKEAEIGAASAMLELLKINKIK